MEPIFIDEGLDLGDLGDLMDQRRGIIAEESEATRYLEEGRGANKNDWIKGFRVFVREVIAPRHRGEPAGGL